MCKKQIFRIETKGRTGTVTVDVGRWISHEELIQSLEPLPPEIDNEKAEATREKRGMHLVRFGASMFWIPTGVEVVSKSHLVCLRKAASIKKKLDDLFDGERCSLNKEALTI